MIRVFLEAPRSPDRQITTPHQVRGGSQYHRKSLLLRNDIFKTKS
jgi:hypothetical protein